MNSTNVAHWKITYFFKTVLLAICAAIPDYGAGGMNDDYSFNSGNSMYGADSAFARQSGQGDLYNNGNTIPYNDNYVTGNATDSWLGKDYYFSNGVTGSVRDNYDNSKRFSFSNGVSGTVTEEPDGRKHYRLNDGRTGESYELFPGVRKYSFSDGTTGTVHEGPGDMKKFQFSNGVHGTIY